MKWQIQPQETDGTYRFSGTFFATRGVADLIGKEEALKLYAKVKKLVKEKDGIDYLIVVIHEDTGQKLFFIDQLNDEMIASGGHPREHNHCTLMLAEEY